MDDTVKVNVEFEANSGNALVYPVEGAKLGKYADLKYIGEGGQARVYSAMDTVLNRRVALKVLSLNSGNLEEVTNRFDREVKMQATLKLPELVPLFERGSEGGWTYFSMELIEGPTLAEWVKRAKPSIVKRLEVILSLAGTVERLHRAGLCHRDLKPENIIITHEGDLKVLDLGLMKAADDSMNIFKTTQGIFLGTPAYAAPERLPNERLGNDAQAPSSLFSADAYALGVLGYELLAGRLPYEIEPGMKEAEVMEIITATPAEPLRNHNPEIPAKVSDSFARLLQKKPDKRPSLREFIGDLESAVSQLKREGKQARLKKMVAVAVCTMLIKRANKRARIRLAIVVVTILLLITGLVLFLASD